jgi:hypothetical protein
MATPRYEDVQVDSVFVIADNVYDVPGFSPGDEVRCASRTGIKATFEKVGGFETMDIVSGPVEVRKLATKDT